MRDILACALKSLRRKWSRTLLTVSSITVGVSMVAIVSMISTMGKQVVNQELDSLGVNGLSVSSSGDNTLLDEGTLEIIRNLSGVDTAMPLMIEYANATLRESCENSLICGIDSGATQAISLTLKHGRLISQGDVRGAAMVCVVDETVARKAYSRENIVGKTIFLNIGGVEEAFQIVGITEAGSSLLQNLTELIPGMVYIPYTTMQNLTGRDTFNQIAVRVSGDASQTENRIIKALERSAGVADGFRTDNLAVQKERLGGLMDIVTLILTAISGISLIVSGLGIMTIMLVSVSERTKEIGIKKAIGASRNRIMLEFLAEAAVISLLGSLTGILSGAGLMAAAALLIGQPLILPLQAFALLVGFSLLIGCVFGVYPALKASRLRPVDALRQDG